ncbi:penicillin-binding transpeptidase domain-containing protein [Streptomyces benahoarensis]|uniref:Penicillin-binding protein n=1 Tax=Streptomyces benahoarensis TaxID=2595054 RepID=A0A553XSM5_9ACTN|nr:penicillin-binding transpeptidase domain-containing protein [Streptomyces benahoarensis]TSB19976.1 penicillin-binding protein [Streptomyces benahoarensis]TSB21491.1 penicillin-binding protein [Streptomyces benahoarensis]
MRREVKYGLIGGSAVLVAGVVGGFALFGGGSDDSSAQGVTAADAKNGGAGAKAGPASAQEIATTSRDFLAAWQSADAAKAAGLTDDPAAAKTALGSFAKQAHFSHVTVKPGAPNGDKVPYTVTAQLSYQGHQAPYSYTSALHVRRDAATGEPRVNWNLAVLHPALTNGDTLRTGPSGTAPINAVDRNGKPLTAEDHPELAGVLEGLRDKFGGKAGGTPGIELAVHHAADGKNTKPDTPLKVLTKGSPGTLKTTLDATLQAIAQKQVDARKNASAVAIKPSTGEILALAHSPAKGFNVATGGSLAPGSTMKIVTAALLMDKGLTSPGKQHPCPKYTTVAGWKFHNDQMSEIPHGTFAQSFAASCNNAFIGEAKNLNNDDLTVEARDVFGIGLNWQTGVPTFDGIVPVQDGAQMGASLIGQGGVRMNPLNVASLAATAQSGVFRQPYLVSPDVDHRKLATAARRMKPDTAAGLKSLMRTTAVAGTAVKPMAGLSGDIGAKTGSAEVDNQKKPNAWFTAYRNDMAAAALVPASGHGGDNAGPVVRALLSEG